MLLCSAFRRQQDDPVFAPGVIVGAAIRGRQRTRLDQPRRRDLVEPAGPGTYEQPLRLEDVSNPALLKDLPGISEGLPDDRKDL